MKAISIANNKIGKTNRLSTAFVDRRAKDIVLKRLGMLAKGSLTIDDQGKHFYFGEPSNQADINARLVVRCQSFYRSVLLGGIVGAGESFMRGAWSSSDLVSVVRVMCQNLETLYSFNSGWAKLSSFMSNIIHRLRLNNKKNSRRNISAHYDLGNDFFALFLDSSMMYSSAIYPRSDVSLEEASRYKLDHVCRRLKLNKKDHLLEIGTGWGGMAIHAAKYYGCRVTTTTISKEQYAHAVEQVRAAGLEDRITVLLDDYRDLEGQFDKLVSIEMIEAVGPQYYSDYFSACSRLLKPNGLMLIQAITMPDQRYIKTSDEADFIQLYIFPGGHLPCSSLMAEHVAKDTDMQIVGLEDISLDYALTLRDWRRKFFENLPTVMSLGYDDVFIRMWDFYLSYCEGGFKERTIGTVQMLMAKPMCMSLPVVGKTID